MNRLQLTASIVEREVLRYTPAGVPVAGCTLQHHTEVVEAGIARQVELTLPALAAGEVSGRIEGCVMGVEMLFTGFLAKKHRNARTLVFHITELQDIGKD
ncbi:primosomal replication protein N [Paraburkholderia hayleyella]|uniref:primosomal replication protein N n=1 Tax=Paraburkholderia hayleyella TaxID=2152889 RepID=UPI0012909429|nr:primosomal replication protein N [Paraburkholderia hayleyella]